MPYSRRKKTYSSRARTTRRTNKKGSYSRRGRSYRKGYNKVSRRGTLWKNPISNQAFFKFTYHDSAFPFATTAISGYQYKLVFRGNSLYDPYEAVGGVQPYAYDNYFTANGPYTKYICYGSKITLYPHIYTATMPENPTAGIAARLIVFPSRNTSENWYEFEDLSRCPFNFKRCIENADDAGGNNILKKYISTRKLIPEAGRLEDDDYGAYYNANPVKQWYWNFYVDTAEFQNEISGYVDVKIDYYVRARFINDVNESS